MQREGYLVSICVEVYGPALLVCRARKHDINALSNFDLSYILWKYGSFDDY
jgi:hypothetical protein